MWWSCYQFIAFVPPKPTVVHSVYSMSRDVDISHHYKEQGDMQTSSSFLAYAHCLHYLVIK